MVRHVPRGTWPAMLASQLAQQERETIMHAITTDRTMLGERFITCTCGHVAQGPAYGSIADQNFAYHIKTAGKGNDHE